MLELFTPTVYFLSIMTVQTTKKTQGVLTTRCPLGPEVEVVIIENYFSGFKVESVFYPVK